MNLGWGTTMDWNIGKHGYIGIWILRNIGGYFYANINKKNYLKLMGILKKFQKIW